MSEHKLFWCLISRSFLLFCLLTLSPLLSAAAVPAQDTSTIVAYFKNQAIPVESVSVKDDVITTKVDYEDHEDRSLDEKKSDLITIAKKIATEFPSSGVILVQQFIGPQKVVEMGWKTQDAVDFNSGQTTQTEFMKKMKMNFDFDIESKLKADVPRKPIPKTPVQVNPGGGGGGGSGYRAGGTIDTGLIIIIVVFSLLIFLSVIIITLLIKRRQPPAQPQGRISAALDIYSPDGSSKRYHLNKARITIGRSSSCSISINDPEASSRHVEIFVHEGQFFLRDSGSANGTFVNGKKTKECALYARDEIRIGTTRLIFGA
ncbi:FHA domain-containing protein [Acidobacteriota bacterium]